MISVHERFYKQRVAIEETESGRGKENKSNKDKIHILCNEEEERERVRVSSVLMSFSNTSADGISSTLLT